MNVTIAEVLHFAADELLWDGSGDTDPDYIYSCDAAMRAAQRLGGWGLWPVVECGLANMGVDTGSLGQFDNIGDRMSAERQAARYAWLKFAALIAEEQGV
jgi:hypothetical protein